jgi:tripeptidyl-peptidase-1
MLTEGLQAGVIPGAHWNATLGWDPTTGFGVPNFGKLLELLGDL